LSLPASSSARTGTCSRNKTRNRLSYYTRTLAVAETAVRTALKMLIS